MAYLTTNSLPTDVASIMAWHKPTDLTLHVTIDLMSDTLMVQLGWRRLVRGVKFGVVSLPKEDVLFMLDRCASDLRDDIKRHIASGEKPSPPWVQRISESMEKFGYDDKTHNTIVRTLTSTGVDDMPPPVVKHRFSGSPQLCWSDESRELVLDFSPSGEATCRSRFFGGKIIGHSTSSPESLGVALAWFRDKVADVDYY